MRTAIRLTIAAFVFVFAATTARAEEIRVLSSVGIKAVIDVLGPQFEQKTKHKVTTTFDLAGVLKTRIEGGEPFDVAILTPAMIDELISKGKIAPATRVEVARTGLNETEAREAGFEYSTSTVEPTARAGYFPDATTITVKVVVDRNSHRLLGAQIVGKEGAAKRIDVLATALWNEMTVDEIADLDLGYAPPFSPLWDPVQVAARQSAHDR